MAAQVVELHRHPVKGFPAERLGAVDLNSGEGLPFDRRFGFTAGRREHVPTAGGWVPSRTFLMMTLEPELTTYSVRLDDEEQTLTITDPNGESATVSVGEADTFYAANALINAHYTGGEFGKPYLAEQAPGVGHWDYNDSAVSIINLATTRALAEAAGRPLEKERFRGNVYIDGLDPWEEFSWTGGRVRIGDAELEVRRPIQRCAMTSTEPGTGIRELDLPEIMNTRFGHNFCGLYTRVVKRGAVSEGTTVELVEADVTNPEEGLPDHAATPPLWPHFATASRNANGDLAIQTDQPWCPLKTAQAGQKIRIHNLHAKDQPQRLEIADVDDGVVHVHSNVEADGRILVSGPFGRTG